MNILTKVIGLIGLSLALAGCNATAGGQRGVDAVKVVVAVAPSVSPKVEQAVNKIDARIAQASAQVARYCPLVRTGVALGGMFISDPKVSRVVEIGRTAIGRFCDVPPVDIVEAAELLQATLADIERVTAQAKI